MFRKIIRFCVKRPRAVMLIVGVLVLAGLIQFPKIKVDTNPENMLPGDEPVRVFDHRIKEEFGLYDFIILGVVNEDAPEGVFTPATLKNVYFLSNSIKGIEGVIGHEIISPATKDDIEQAGPGSVRFKWLMDKPPYTPEEARHIRERAMANPLYYGTIISENGKALSLFIPIESKDMSYRVSREIRALTEDIGGAEKYYITGLPVAEDTFGVEMFRQMAISAPLAMLVIFILMYGFFKNIRLVIAPLLLAGVTVVITMGALIGSGATVHIMSSMIPIFLMPIAVLDSVHILSEFYDRYRKAESREKALMETIDELFMPMLFTSLTTTAGFLSLAFAEIPPVQVFGIFVAIGVMLAWLLTMTFIPASIVLMKKEWLEGFGAKSEHQERSFLNRFLKIAGGGSLRRWKLVLAGTALIIGVSFVGISRIVINDNPMKWFTEDHKIRVADRVLNRNFGGTYTAYLVAESAEKGAEVFKEPEMLGYVERLQEHLVEKGTVGKATSVADVVKKVYYELLGGDRQNSVIPSSKKAVAQTLLSFQNSHNPEDLWHFVDPDYDMANIWIQLKSGDNLDMSRVVDQVDAYISENPPPFDVSFSWAGLTYINVVWQDRMVKGMLRNFAGSFIIVLLMMIFLFRSPVRGLISMIPLTVTILFIYSLLGFVGKNYDMPVAVLSALTLGLSVDFAIHFLQRAREIQAGSGNWTETADRMFGGPGRAILRNALIISIGFLPLLAAPLVPYKTVGVFMFLIMVASSVATIIILPAMISAMPGLVFDERTSPLCRCSYSVLLSLVAAGTIVYILRGYSLASWGVTTILCIVVVAATAGICNVVSKRKICVEARDERREERE
ncbi:MAG: MMPL family transporter [Candidatus Omnitrophica bacterium]|nr:MMPL family transporter [Candidatus Omnitrophota bacterium]